ncbi:MAG: type II secretion system protein [Opitutaceae bacterium]
MAYSSEINPVRFPVPTSVRRMRSGRGDRGWTLIEILMVLTIIAILVGITLGVSTGVHRRTAIGRAKANLAVLSTALEAYRTQYGDYPWIPAAFPSGISSNEELLFNALAGKVGPKGASLNGKVFVDLSRMNLQNETLPDPGNSLSVSNTFIDPWGQSFRYFHKEEGSEGDWDSPAFRLFSVGVDGLSDDPDSSGLVDYETAKNLDNVYAGKN